MKLSIVVPVYNVEQYLHQCIDSILHQTFQDFELILVDDGSPDDCPKICDEYAKNDSRIKVIHKTNGGLSSARNAGLQIARGEYISFIDSDDFLDPITYTHIFSIFNKENVDVVIFGRYEVYGKNYVLGERQNIYRVMDSAQAIALMNTSILGYYDVAAWDKVYKRELFKNVEYPVGKLSEDWYTTYKVLSKANKVVYDSTPLYYYRQRDNSITHQQTKVNYDAIYASEQVLKFVNKHQVKYINEAIFAYVFASIGVIDNMTMQSTNNRRKIKDIYKNIKPLFSQLKKVPEIKSLDYKRKLQIFLVRYCLDCYIILFPFIKKKLTNKF